MDTMPETNTPAKEELLPLVAQMRLLVERRLPVGAGFGRREANYLAVSNEVERLAQRLGDAAQGAVTRIEAYVRRDEPLPEGAHAVSVGLDRVAVPMEEPRPEGAPPRPVKRKKPRMRKAPEPIDVNYRMAYVG